MQKKFYGKAELALRYYPTLTPDNARHRLMAEINGDATLMRHLRRLGYRKTQKMFTYKQMKIIEEWM